MIRSYWDFFFLRKRKNKILEDMLFRIGINLLFIIVIFSTLVLGILIYIIGG